MGDIELQHRLFIQAFMWKKICDNDEVYILHQKCHDRTKAPVTDLKMFMLRVNTALNALNMGIRKGVDELTGKDYYVMINATDNNISRLSVNFKRQELELFKRIICSLVQSDEGRVSSMSLLNLADNVKTSKKECDEMIEKFIADGWLCKKDGYIFFSTRAIVELQLFFKKNYPNDVLKCFICKPTLVFQGSTCESCGNKMHFHCMKSYFERIGSATCPACSQEFGT